MPIRAVASTFKSGQAKRRSKVCECSERKHSPLVELVTSVPQERCLWHCSWQAPICLFIILY